tara:strand:- start:707 stop:979 length:273 start_codon:yes stop_codon:yes gene_type:complete
MSEKNKNLIINREIFLKFCHNFYDEMHGEKKINKIFDIDEQHINNIKNIYLDNFIWRDHKIFNYLRKNTNVNDELAYAFYINAFQHYFEV